MGNIALGAVFGVLVMSIVFNPHIEEVADSLNSVVLKIETMILECEADLPRNQRCILVAQPEE